MSDIKSPEVPSLSLCWSQAGLAPQLGALSAINKQSNPVCKSAVERQAEQAFGRNRNSVETCLQILSMAAGLRGDGQNASQAGYQVCPSMACAWHRMDVSFREGVKWFQAAATAPRQFSARRRDWKTPSIWESANEVVHPNVDAARRE